MGEPRGEPEPRSISSFSTEEKSPVTGGWFDYDQKEKIMYYNDKITGKRIWKYDLVNEVLAAASAGMSATTGLDQRCIIFTIHLTSEAGHLPLCRALFDTAESYFIKKQLKRRSASYSGLASFIDVNGSKFSGADRDHTQVHCHGSIFIPWNTSPDDTKRLITVLEFAACQACYEEQFIVKSNPNAIEFKVFDPSRTDANLDGWTQYAQKDAARIAAQGDRMIFLPFDNRQDYGGRVADQIERKRNITLSVLRGRERFRILSYL